MTKTLVAFIAVLLATQSPSASGDPLVSCDAVGYHRVAGQVALDSADYMESHPDVNVAFTEMKSNSVHPNVEVTRYLADHPEVSEALAELRQPLKDLIIACGWGELPQ
ncbi:hemophore-related protein [Mycobacteroides abscessus]|uniref:hemophore-related protein n=1 Tax=Mycobacteroides abscessus TaxID=36809 RepID=UPI0013F4E9FD|nr:hemophore-related protein [Mycobacteroides abscessus]